MFAVDLLTDGATSPAEPAQVRIRPDVINLMLGGGATSYSFDRAGRLIGAYLCGVNYRRGHDNRVLCKWSSPAGRERRWLDEDEAESFLETAYALAGRVARQTGDPRLGVLDGWDAARRRADAGEFARVYRPVSILPPDQYLSLVLQASEGCSHNRCTFCDFYRDRPFRLKGAAEFRAHVAAVVRFFGPALGLRRSLFLADANALAAPMRRLREWFAVIHDDPILSETGLAARGIYSFVDAFSAQRRSVADWAELAALGLRRVYIGMESGDNKLLAFLRKPGTGEEIGLAVESLKAAGLAVSVVIMLGIGGDRYAGSHVERTAAALNAMPLGTGDIIYFSPFVDFPGSDYGRLAAEAGIRPLAGPDAAGQEAAIRARLMPRDAEHPPQCSRYQIHEFVY